MANQFRNRLGNFQPLLRSRPFLLVCLLSFACTIVRESFNTWLPTYLHDHLGYGPGRAAGLSAVFPWAGAASASSTAPTTW